MSTNIVISTKMLGWLVGARDGKKLGSGEFYPDFIPTGPVPNFFVMTHGHIDHISTNPVQL